MKKKFKDFAIQRKNNNFCTYEWSTKVVQRGKQTFAIFGELAYDVSKYKYVGMNDQPRGTGKLCVPINGRYLAQFPDEGQSGILGLYIVKIRGKLVMSDPTFILCGWLYTQELEQTNEQIKENIIDDIEDGKNVYYPKPAGWL